jgi:hypothetical protein
MEREEERINILGGLKEKYSLIIPKNEIKALYNKAANFVNGKINKTSGKNKVTINWKRDERDRSVTFEIAHKQSNETSSKYKGYKLKAVLDAVTQIYLDGWDREKILAYLEDRTSLYNLQSKFWYILWDSPEKEGEI